MAVYGSHYVIGSLVAVTQNFLPRKIRTTKTRKCVQCVRLTSSSDILSHIVVVLGLIVAVFVPHVLAVGRVVLSQTGKIFVPLLGLIRDGERVKCDHILVRKCVVISEVS